MKAVTKILTFLRALWGRGLLGKLAVLFILMFACAVVSTILNGGRGRTGSAARPAMPTRTPWTLPTAAPTATLEPTATAGPTATPLLPDDAAKEAAKMVCGDRFRSADIDGGLVVVCQMADGFSDESIAMGAAKDYESLVRAAWLANPNLTYVTLRLDAEFKDKYGKVSENPAFTFRMKAELYQKVNWDNFSTRNLVNLLHTEEELAGIVIHPALRDAWRKMWNR